MTKEMQIVTPFADGYRKYLNAGWTGILPVYGKAGGLPVGTTGRDGVDPSAVDLADWSLERGSNNIALRMNDGCVGIDVDGHGDKRGAQTLQKAVAKWGPLPIAPRSSARPDPLSGIYFFRVPDGVELQDRIVMDGVSDVEIIQRHHRFAVVWPSTHPDTGTQYRWSNQMGNPIDIPAVEDLPPLPKTWLEGLKKDAPAESHPPVDVPPVEAPRDMWDATVLEQFEAVRSAALGEAGSRHDTARDAIMALCRSERRQLTGATTAIDQTVDLWVELMGEERDGTAHKEVVDMIAGGRDLASTTPTSAVDGELPEWMTAGGFELAPEVDPETGEVVSRETGLASEALTAGEVMERPPPVPLVDGWLYLETLAMLWAAPKSGKTFLAIEWGMSVACGIPWAGGKTRKGKVLYLIGEGVVGVAARVRAWSEAHPMSDPGDNIHFIPRAVPLRDPAEALELMQFAKDGDYDFIIVDTFARASVGLEENSAKDMGLAVAILDKLKEATGACVLLVHHAGKDVSRGLRGSSAIGGALDSAVTIDGDLRNMWVKTDFQKDIEPTASVQLRAFPAGDSLILKTPTAIDLEQDDNVTKAMAVLYKAGVPITRTEWKDMLMEYGLTKTLAFNVIGEVIDAGMAYSPDGIESRGARFQAS